MMFHRSVATILLLSTILLASSVAVLAQAAQRSPSDTVREFYKAMRARKFREAFAMSIYRPAVDGLRPAEFDDLRSDFDRMAAAIPDQVQLSGEQISGDSATVFVKVKDAESGAQPEPISLIRVNGQWIIGDRENQAIVERAGKDFFFNARIDTHHSEVQELLKRIALAELAYGQQHNGQFGDLPALISAGLMPKDLEGTETTGYRFRIIISPDRKSWSAAAEPAHYGRTGRLSFFMDATGVRSGDMAGKPLTLARQNP